MRAQMANTRTIKRNLLFVDDLVVLHTLRVIYIRTFTLQTPTLPSLPALCGRISCVKGTPSDPIAHMSLLSLAVSLAPRRARWEGYVSAGTTDRTQLQEECRSFAELADAGSSVSTTA